jgi:hypothetical protein
MEKEFMYNINTTALLHAMEERINDILIPIRHAKMKRVTVTGSQLIMIKYKSN